MTRMRSASRIVQSRCDDETRASVAQRVHAALDQHLGAGVDRTRRVVEDQDGRLGDERARDRDELALAHADLGGLLVDDGVEAVGRAGVVGVAGGLGRP